MDQPLTGKVKKKGDYQYEMHMRLSIDQSHSMTGVMEKEENCDYLNQFRRSTVKPLKAEPKFN